ncbi:MAG: rod shape-determining protein RodA [Candidatus Levyibacteriota bacterium]|nr:MAG: rod shape-determining protein RodA [Candidatus Levybacteria bacterium]
MRFGVLSAIDWSLLVPSLILVIFSLATLFSISVSYFLSQLFYVLLSLVVFIIFSQVHYKAIHLYSLPIYIFSLLAFLFVLFIGFESRGAVRWIDILGFRLQFSEILKPFLIVSFASFLADRKNASFYSFILSLCFLFPIALFIFLQPDLGTAIVYILVVFATILVFGFRLRLFLGILGIFILLLPVFWQFLRDYQRYRILTFLRPEGDPLGTSYNGIQAMIAVGSGALFGKGLGQGTQSILRFLPERHTDFIFATICESFGFIGGLIVIFVFAFLLYRIYILYLSVDDSFRKTFCIAAFFLLLTQFFINVGMNIGLVPIVGITLPFVSYGGSSVLSSFILLGILSSFSYRLKNRETLEIR